MYGSVFQIFFIFIPLGAFLDNFPPPTQILNYIYNVYVLCSMVFWGATTIVISFSFSLKNQFSLPWEQYLPYWECMV